jgi:hypothetical protein
MKSEHVSRRELSEMSDEDLKDSSNYCHNLSQLDGKLPEDARQMLAQQDIALAQPYKQELNRRQSK